MFNHRVEGNTLFLEGDLDAYNGPTLRKVLDQFNQGEVIINLAGVKFLSSAALVEFLQLSRRLTDQGGRLCLAGANEEARTVFHVTGFDRIFTVLP